MAGDAERASSIFIVSSVLQDVRNPAPLRVSLKYWPKHMHFTNAFARIIILCQPVFTVSMETFMCGQKRRLSRSARDNLRKRMRMVNIHCRVEELKNICENEAAENSGDDEGPLPPPSPSEPGSSTSDRDESGDNSEDNEGSLPPPSPSETSSHDSGSSDGSELNDTGDDNSGSSDEPNETDSDNENFEDIFNNLNEEEKKEYLLSNLRDWSLRGITKVKVDDLLRILRPFHDFLPKSSKTLHKTPRTTEAIDVGNGVLWYKGICEGLLQNLPEDYFVNHDDIAIDINIEGLPIHDSSDKEFWPILGCAKDLQEPFIIGVYYGVGKPENVERFLHNYTNEVSNLMNNGFEYHGTVYPFKVRHYILDAPARAFVKQCIGHGGYYACEKCVIPGRWFMNRMTFIGINYPLRTDDSFLARETPHHHNGISPLEIVGTGMVSQFQLDAMHLVYVGVVKRMLSFLFFRRSTVHLPDNSIVAINDFLDNISSDYPSEFNRLPRSIGTEEKSKLKATELRSRFVEGPLKVGNLHVLPPPQLLVHLPQECLDTASPLDDFSSFKFENYLKTIKQTLKSPVKPLQQLARRDKETKGKLLNPKDPYDPDLITLRKCDFYDFPMRSSTLNIFTVTRLQDRTLYWNLNDVTSKNIAIPLGESYYSVVRFMDGDTVGVVPTKWLTRKDNKLLTYWPSCSKISTTRMIMQYDDHLPTWKKYEVAKMHEYSSYNKANRACIVAENKTDIDTAAGDSDIEFGTRKRNRPARLISDDEDPEREPAKKKKSSPIVNSSDEEEDGHEEKLENVRNQLVVHPPALSSVSSTSTLAASPFVPKEKQPKPELSRQRAFYILDDGTDLVSEVHSAIQARREAESQGLDRNCDKQGNKHVKELIFQDETGGCDNGDHFLSDNNNNSEFIESEEPEFIGSEKPAKASTSRFMESPTKNFPKSSTSSTKHFKIAALSPKSSKSVTRTVSVSSLDKSEKLMIQALLWQYEEISSKLDFIIARIQLLQRTINPEEEALSRPKGAPSFPLFTEESLQELEKYLESDVNFKLTMGYLQAHIDGVETPSKATKILLKKVITNRLARILIYSGTGGSKISVSNTRLLDCILCAIKTVFKKDSYLEGVKNVVQRWLCTANQRVLEPIPPKKENKNAS
ncbi:Halomucin [Frankliniella fusca]|uniref:Halomucin n=1 Tax=Frankliniella fusca TaxID=407009 RepID=A0AAE1GSS7_9NEOP|nr:Halomucin [Frankliniella fusca]